MYSSSGSHVHHFVVLYELLTHREMDWRLDLNRYCGDMYIPFLALFQNYVLSTLDLMRSDLHTSELRSDVFLDTN